MLAGRKEYNIKSEKGASKMFILKSKQQLTKAIENARALHPKVKMIEFGAY